MTSKHSANSRSVVPTAAYVRFATHYSFRPDLCVARPDLCEAQDPESKGTVETLVRYARSDLVVPADDFGGDVTVANAAAVVWCDEVNTAVHSEIAVVPHERLAVERGVLRVLPSLRPTGHALGVARKVDKLATVRPGSARYSVPRTPRGPHVDVTTVDDRFVAAAHERRALGIAPHRPFERGRLLPEHVTATCLLDRLPHHVTVVVTEDGSSACGRPAHEQHGVDHDLIWPKAGTFDDRQVTLRWP